MLMNLQGGVEQGIRAVYAGWSNSGKMARPICMVLLSLVLEGCARPSVQEPVTLTLLEEWSNKTFSEARAAKAGLGAKVAGDRRFESGRIWHRSDLAGDAVRIFRRFKTIFRHRSLPPISAHNRRLHRR